MSDNESEPEVADLSNPAVTDKYKVAAGIANRALQAVMDACIEGADVATLCAAGDAHIDAECDKVYNQKVQGRKLDKGVGFPTSIALDETCGNFSPLKTESRVMHTGQVCKVDLGVHIDGFIACAAHTIVVTAKQGEAPPAVEGRKADVMMAAHWAAEAAARLLANGGTNASVTAAIKAVCDDFDVRPVQGILSHELKQGTIDGEKCIINCENAEERVEAITFETNEVYCIDIVVSSGDGRTKETDARTTVFKRALENQYQLKTPKARQFLAEVTKRFPYCPFSIRAIEDSQVRLLGVSEARRHELLHAYPVLNEKDGEFVAQVKFTICILPSGQKKITGLDPEVVKKQLALVKSTHEVKNEDIKKLLATSMNPKKKKKAAKSDDKEKK